MSKREKIILVAVGIVVVAAVYIQFFAGPGHVKGPDLAALKQELTSFVTSTSTVMGQAKPSEEAVYTIAGAQRPWTRDPFLATNEPIDIGKAEKILFPSFHYTGFVGHGSRRIAVINGAEYEAGQELDIPGFVLKTISPDQVIIGAKGKEQETTVQIVEGEQSSEAQPSKAPEPVLENAPKVDLRPRKALAWHPGAVDAPAHLPD